MVVSKGEDSLTGCNTHMAISFSTNPTCRSNLFNVSMIDTVPVSASVIVVGCFFEPVVTCASL